MGERWREIERVSERLPPALSCHGARAPDVRCAVDDVASDAALVVVGEDDLAGSISPFSLVFCGLFCAF